MADDKAQMAEEVDLQETQPEAVVPPVEEPLPSVAPTSVTPPSEPPAPADELHRAGQWAGMPNYGCPYCGYRTLDGTASVKDHILRGHPDKDPEEPAPIEET